jgi:hypothetical protein
VKFKSIKVKSWQEKQGDMSVKVEMHQDAPDCFEVACYRLGQTIPVLYRFSTFESANARYTAFIDFHKDGSNIEPKLIAELDMLHRLCESAQCWLDAACFVTSATSNHATKCALQRNADAFRQAYGKITS